MSPSFASDPNEHRAYVEFLGYYKNEAWDDIARDISREWIKMEHLQARPHWAKMWAMIDTKEIQPYLKKVYGENWNKWKELRDKFDPTRTFMNKWAEDIFYKEY